MITRLPDVESLGELLQTVRSAVDEFARSRQIVLLQRSANLCFVALEKAREQFRGDVRLVRQRWICDQLITQADRGAVDLIVRASGELDVSTAFEIRAVRVVPDYPELSGCRTSQTAHRQALY